MISLDEYLRQMQSVLSLHNPPKERKENKPKGLAIIGLVLLFIWFIVFFSLIFTRGDVGLLYP